MKSPLVYLTATKLKNQLIAVVKSPAKLIYAVILVALFRFGEQFFQLPHVYTV